MIPVTITIDRKGIRTRPTLVKVPKRRPNERISWTIATPGWRFARHGIVIHLNDHQFTARGSDHRQEFHWISRNTKRKRYEYSINVTNGATVASRDPGIKNGGR